jgi:Glycine transporter
MNELLNYGRQLAGPALIVLDLLGTFVFALSGAADGVKNKLDLFGLVMVAFATGNAGGITRDLLIGAVPPAAIHDWRYLAACFLAGLVTFWWYPQDQCSSHPRAALGCCRPGPLCRDRDPEGARCRAEPGYGGGYGHAERHWGRHRSGHPCQRNADCTSGRLVRRSRTSGRAACCRRACLAPSAIRGHDLRCTALLLFPMLGHIPGMASPNRKSCLKGALRDDTYFVICSGVLVCRLQSG